MDAEQAAAWRKAFSQAMDRHDQVILPASFGFTPLPPLKRRISELAAARQAWLDPAGDNIDAADEKLLEFLAALDQAKTVTALDAAAAPPQLQMEPSSRPAVRPGKAAPLVLLAVAWMLLAMPWEAAAWLGQLILVMLVLRQAAWAARVVRRRIRGRG